MLTMLGFPRFFNLCFTALFSKRLFGLTLFLLLLSKTWPRIWRISTRRALKCGLISLAPPWLHVKTENCVVGLPREAKKWKAQNRHCSLFPTLKAFKQTIPPSRSPKKKEEPILLTAKVVFLKRSQVLRRGPSKYARRWRRKKGMPHSMRHTLPLLTPKASSRRRGAPCDSGDRPHVFL